MYKHQFSYKTRLLDKRDGGGSPWAWPLTLVFLSSFPAPSLPLLTMRADKTRNENARYTHLHGSRRERNVIRLISQDSATCFVQLGLLETRPSSPESVRSLTVSIYAARWGHCWEHPEGAAGWPRGHMQRGHRGNCCGHTLAQGGQVPPLRLPSCLCRAQLTPRLRPTPLQRGGSSDRLWPPAGPPAHAVTQGQGE